MSRSHSVRLGYRYGRPNCAPAIDCLHQPHWCAEKIMGFAVCLQTSGFKAEKISFAAPWCSALKFQGGVGRMPAALNIRAGRRRAKAY
jgi:hypothetical protein